MKKELVFAECRKCTKEGDCGLGPNSEFQKAMDPLIWYKESGELSPQDCRAIVKIIQPEYMKGLADSGCAKAKAILNPQLKHAQGQKPETGAK